MKQIAVQAVRRQASKGPLRTTFAFLTCWRVGENLRDEEHVVSPVRHRLSDNRLRARPKHFGRIDVRHSEVETFSERGDNPCPAFCGFVIPEAQRVLADRAAGRDPQAEKREAKRRVQSDQVAILIAEFIKRHVSQNRSARETTRILNREVLPSWGLWTIHEVRKNDVVVLLDKVRERGAPVMANRVLAAVRKFFNWCIARGILERSPCAGVGMPSREQSRHQILADEQLRPVLMTSRDIGFPFGSIVEFLALTGQRRDEVSRMAWDHVDVERHLWVIPPEHSKNGKPHSVHLSDQAISVLRAVPRTGQLIFVLNGNTPFQGYSKAKKRLDRTSGVSGWTLHDLRRTVVSGMARLGVAPHVADKILNHQGGTISGVAAVYQRHEFMNERKAALNLWGKHVSEITAREVHPLRTPEFDRAA